MSSRALRRSSLRPAPDVAMQRVGAFAFCIYLALTTLILGVFAAPMILFGADGARGAVKIWARTILTGLRALTGVRHRIEGAEHLPKDGAIVAANHQSMWETVVFFTLLPKPVFILKKELLRIPVFGWWAKPAGNIAVDRKGGARALRALRREAADKIARGCQVIVFPESTRLQPGEVRKFQPGVAGVYLAANAPCVPVAHDSGRHWRHPGIMKVPGEIILRILPAIAPGLDRREFLETLQERIIAARPDLVASKTDG